MLLYNCQEGNRKTIAGQAEKCNQDKRREIMSMKKLATTQLRNENEEIFFNEYEDGSYEKVIDEVATESSLEELQSLIDTGKYNVQELTW